MNAHRGLRDWLIEAARVAVLRRPRWERLDARPRTLAAMVLLNLLVLAAWQRLSIDGAASFSWRGLLDGWAGFALAAWLCWVVARAARGGDDRSPADVAPSAGTLLTLHGALWLGLVLASAAVLLLKRAAFGAEDLPPGWAWAVWLAPLIWFGAAEMLMLWRLARAWLPRLLTLGLIPAAIAIGTWLHPMVVWWPSRADSAEELADYGLRVDEEVIAAQSRLLGDALDTVPRSTPGRVNVYAITFAPYGTEDVFMHESAVVARTMAERFDAGDRTVQLVMNPKTVTTLPWATRPNLHQAIARMATLMDRDKDVLFLHLTSHGGRDGQLAADAWPLKTEPLTPDQLKQWLDEAGIRWRVISISACFSGSWIAPLSGDGTLVMTAADATHTSYGCGSRSPLTFFGQAMYVDALKDTWSFRDAHARARQLIEVREREAGKTDGYSNPQIDEGVGIGEVLRRLEAQQRERAPR